MRATRRRHATSTTVRSGASRQHGACGTGGPIAFREDFPIVPAKASIEGLTAGPRSLTVTVQDQKDTGITGYRVDYRPEGATDWQTKLFDVDEEGTSDLLLTGLDVGKKYEVQVLAYVETPEDTWIWWYEDYFFGEASDVRTSDAIAPVDIADAKVAVASQTYTGRALTPAVSPCSS